MWCQVLIEIIFTLVIPTPHTHSLCGVQVPRFWIPLVPNLGPLVLVRLRSVASLASFMCAWREKIIVRLSPVRVRRARRGTPFVFLRCVFYSTNSPSVIFNLHKKTLIWLTGKKITARRLCLMTGRLKRGI